MGMEHRQFIRLDARLNVSYTIAGTKQLGKALSKNISGGGVRFVAEHPLEVGGVGRAELRDLPPELVDDRVRDVGAEVGGDQRVLETRPRVVVDRRAREHPPEGRTERPRSRHATMVP